MFNWIQRLFSSKPKSRIGIDIGSSSIKLVEISSDKGARLRLETYGAAFLSGGEKSQENILEKKMSVEGIKSEELKTTFGEETEKFKEINLAPAPDSILAVFSNEEIGRVIKELLVRSGAKTNIIYFSLPVFASFATTFKMPVLPQNELAAAIPFEAKKYIPVPLEEVVLDWNIVGRVSANEKNISAQTFIDGKEEKTVEIFLVAILKNVIDRYFEISRLSNLSVSALEPESISLARSLAGSKSVVLVDVGSFFANINLIEQGIAKIIHNIKKPTGTDGKIDKEKLLEEAQKVLNQYRGQGGAIKEGEFKYIFTGGGASGELADFFREKLGKEIILGNPFSELDYPAGIEKSLEEISPIFGVAAGAAMRN